MSQGLIQGEGAPGASPYPNIGKKNSHEIPQKCSHLPPLGAIFLSAPLTWNPGSAPIDLNMYIINVIADDESKIGLYEIYFLND